KTGMIRREFPPIDLQSLAREAFRLIKFSLRVAKKPQFDEGFGCFGTVGAKNCVSFLQRRAQQRICLVKLAKLLIDAAEILVEFGLHLRIGVERLRLLHTTIYQRYHAQRVRWADGLVPARKQIHHESLDTVRSGSLGQCGIARSSQANGKE